MRPSGGSLGVGAASLLGNAFLRACFGAGPSCAGSSQGCFEAVVGKVALLVVKGLLEVADVDWLE